jgi:MFS family permease
MRGALAVLLSSPLLRNAFAATALASFPLYGLMSWSAPFYHRVFDADLSRLGLVLALIYALAGGIGMLLGGYLADRLGQFDRRWRLRIPALMTLVAGPAIALQCFAPGVSLSLVGAAIAILALNAAFPSITALVQSLVGPSSRAFSASVLSLIIVLSGLGLGPLVIGSLSDLGTTIGLGPEWSLRCAIGASMIPALLSADRFRKATAQLKR